MHERDSTRKFMSWFSASAVLGAKPPVRPQTLTGALPLDAAGGPDLLNFAPQPLTPGDATRVLGLPNWLNLLHRCTPPEVSGWRPKSTLSCIISLRPTDVSMDTLHWLRVSGRIEDRPADIQKSSRKCTAVSGTVGADGRFILQAPILFWCHRSSDQPSVAVLSQLLARRPRTPCQKM